ncbi:hypothetical protein BKA62DRAFT_767912 [Auriculariales sp. MPI-PUGE-AT-0066]|nr:hypothetical protein BKA62DRAFT_767912 [Auriculariales sp. MPI-PUGE-AT-0066]
MSIAKAKLYYGTTSGYSAVARLTIAEKGYGDDEIEWKEVDMAAAENYNPAYLRINPFGTVPALVIPLEKTLHDSEVKYKALTDSRPIVEFLDKSRSVRSKTHTTSEAPAPVLMPATISHLDTSNRIIDAMNNPWMGVYSFACRTEDALEKFAGSIGGARVQGRYEGLLRAIREQDEIGLPPKVVPTLEARRDNYFEIVKAMEAIRLAKATRTPEQQAVIDNYIAKSDAHWTESLPKQLAIFEKEIVGPFSLGDQVSIADVYLAVYITRLVVILGGDGTPGSVAKVPGVGPKLTAFWEAFIQRPSWQKVYGKQPF